MKLFQNKALTLIEIIVSSLIFSAILTGFLSVVVSIRRLNREMFHRLQAINLARGVLEELCEEVREDTWDSGGLSVGLHDKGTVAILDQIDYSAKYSVSSGPGGEIRKVRLDIEWEER